jgi:hypothetical protein
VYDCTANYKPVLSSERRPTWRRKKVIATQRNLKSGHLPQRGPDSKTNWPAERNSNSKLREFPHTAVRRIGSCSEMAASLRRHEPGSRGTSTVGNRYQAVMTVICKVKSRVLLKYALSSMTNSNPVYGQSRDYIYMYIYINIYIYMKWPVTKAHVHGYRSKDDSEIGINVQRSDLWISQAVK